MTDEEIKESLKNALKLIEHADSIQTELIEEAKKAPSVGSFMWP